MSTHDDKWASPTSADAPPPVNHPAPPAAQPAPPTGPAWQTGGPAPTAWSAPPGPEAAPSAWGQPTAAQWGAPPPGAAAPSSGPPSYGPPGQGGQSGKGVPGGAGWRAVAAIRPGIIPLRPLALGDIYDGAFQAMRRNPRTMIGASAVVFVVIGTVQAVLLALTSGSLTSLMDASLTGEELNESDLLQGVGSLGVASVLSQVVYLFGTALIIGILTLAVGRAVLGEKLGPQRLWGMVRPRLLAIIGLQLLVGLVYVLVAVVAYGPGVALLLVSTELGVVVILIGIPVSIVLWVLVWCVSAVGTPALLLEELSVVRALGRGVRIVRMAFWRCVGILLLTALIMFVLVSILSSPAQVVPYVVGAIDPDPQTIITATIVASSIASAVASTVSTPFLASVATLLYIDVRMRREGLDVELASAAAAR